MKSWEKMKANCLEYQWWDKTRMKDLGEGMKHEAWLVVSEWTGEQPNFT